MSLYHADYGIPKRIRLRWGILDLDYTILQERHPGISTKAYPTTLDTDEAEVVEVEDDKLGFTKKVVYRIQHDLTQDMVLVVLPNVDVMENLKQGVVLEVFFVNEDENVRKKDWYDKP